MIKGQKSIDEFIATAVGHIHIYTDGACSGNPGAGGYGAYMHDMQKNEFELSGGEQDTTNNRMEMLAAVKALECFYGTGFPGVTDFCPQRLESAVPMIQNISLDPGSAPCGLVRETSSGQLLKLTIYTDSQYLKNGINTWIKSWKKNGWKTAGRQPVKNQDLWIRLDELQTKITPQWEWVRGHSNVYGNERADALARNAVVALRMR